MAKYYRTSEPVPVEPISDADRWSSQQGIRLSEREWTAYVVESLAGRDYSVVVRAKAEAGPAVFELTVNSRTQELVVPQGDWCEVSGKPADLSQGTNRIRGLVRSGVVHLDWISVN